MIHDALLLLMLEAVTTDLVSPSASSAAPKIFSYPQARPADYPISRCDCVAKLFRSRSQSSFLSAGGSLVALPGVGATLLYATPTQGRPLPKVAGHGREAWRAA